MPLPSSEFLPNESSERTDLGRGQVPLLVLGVHVQHVERFLRRLPVVDDPQASPLPASLCRPSHLAQAAAARDNRPLLGAEYQRQLEGQVFLVPKQGRDALRESGLSTKRTVYYKPVA